MNRRNLKKQISYVCGDIALECHFAANSIPGVDVKKLYQIGRASCRERV